MLTIQLTVLSTQHICWALQPLSQSSLTLASRWIPSKRGQGALVSSYPLMRRQGSSHVRFTDVPARRCARDEMIESRARVPSSSIARA